MFSLGRLRQFLSRTALSAALLACLVTPSSAQSRPEKTPTKAVSALRELHAEPFGQDSFDDQGNLLRVALGIGNKLPSPSDDDLAKLVRAFPKLEFLYFRHVSTTSVSPEGLRHLERLPNLRTLWISGLGFTNEHAQAISGLPQLEELSLSTGALTRRGAELIGNLQGLKSLRLRVRSGDDEIGGLILQQFPKLTRLHITGSSLSGITFRETGKLTDLRMLSLGYCPRLTAMNFRHIRNLTQLEIIYLSTGRARNDWLAHLAPLNSLKSIEISSGNVDDAGISQLSGLTNIENLRITGAPITDKSLAAFAGMTKLRKLRLFSPHIDGSGFVHLRRLKRLESLQFHQIPGLGLGIQPEHIHHLAELSGLKHLDVAWTPLSQGNNWKSVAVLKDLKHLAVIEIELQPDDAKALKQLLPGCRIYFAD